MNLKRNSKDKKVIIVGSNLTVSKSRLLKLKASCNLLNLSSRKRCYTNTQKLHCRDTFRARDEINTRQKLQFQIMTEQIFPFISIPLIQFPKHFLVGKHWFFLSINISIFSLANRKDRVNKFLIIFFLFVCSEWNKSFNCFSILF